MLFLGLSFALVCGQPYPAFNMKMSKMLLQYSVVGLGFGMNVEASLSPVVIRQVGVKPLLQGVILWVLVSVVALAVIVCY